MISLASYYNPSPPSSHTSHIPSSFLPLPHDWVVIQMLGDVASNFVNFFEFFGTQMDFGCFGVG